MSRSWSPTSPRTRGNPGTRLVAASLLLPRHWAPAQGAQCWRAKGRNRALLTTPKHTSPRGEENAVRGIREAVIKGMDRNTSRAELTKLKDKFRKKGVKVDQIGFGSVGSRTNS